MAQHNYIIIGASGGIGSETARQLAKKGAKLGLLTRSREKVLSLAEKVGGQAIECEASSFEELEKAVQAFVEEHGMLNGIVNCAGSLMLKGAHLSSEKDFHATVQANLQTAFSAVRAGAKAMMKDGGSIVLISSAAARTGLPNHEAIAAAKAGIIGLGLSAAATYASYGIRVNVVAPGMVETPLTENMLKNDVTRKVSQSMHALQKIGTPSDIASAITWLVDPSNHWVTGQVIGVDGGLGTIRPKMKA